MATIKNHIAFLVRGMKASVDFEVRLTHARGSVPGTPPKRAQTAGPHEPGQVRARPEEGNRRLERGRRQPDNRVTLRAAPNPVPADTGVGTTTVAWSTEDGSEGEVRVAMDGEPEKPFAQGSTGAEEVNWIRAGRRYEFRLYAGTDRTSPLASVTVKTALELPPEDPDYAARVAAEQEVFAERQVVHDLPLIYHYWSHNHLRPVVESLGFGTLEELFAQTFERAYRARTHDGQARFASVGAGNCEAEVQLAQDLLARGCEDFVIECLELNPAMLERGEAHARSAGVEGYIKGLEVDFNRWKPEGRYDGILANQALHHVVNLEGLFDAIHRVLTPEGLFVTSDMIGRNGHQRWPEARRIVEHFWKELPRSYRFHNLLQRQEDEFLDWDCSQEGFEGIRAQDVLPLLVERFHFELFLGFANVIDVFIDRGFGPNFDCDREWDREFIDRVHLRDVEGLLSGELKPTHIMAVMRTTPAPEGPRVWRHLTPEFCVRRP